MKWSIPVLAAVMASMGCAAQQKPGTRPGDTAPGASSPAVLDVTPAASHTPGAPVYVSSTPGPYIDPGPAYVPPAPGPAYVPPAAPADVPAPRHETRSEPRAATDSSAKRYYVVRHGDTLYRIAREHYGDAKAWRRIAAANPNVVPASLRVGQKLVMP